MLICDEIVADLESLTLIMQVNNLVHFYIVY